MTTPEERPQVGPVADERQKKIVFLFQSEDAEKLSNLVGNFSHREVVLKLIGFL